MKRWRRLKLNRHKIEQECRYKAEKAMGGSQGGYSAYSVVFYDLGESLQRGNLVMMFMKTKGYTD
jgi:hypothetical protein